MGRIYKTINGRKTLLVDPLPGDQNQNIKKTQKSFGKDAICKLRLLPLQWQYIRLYLEM